MTVDVSLVALGWIGVCGLVWSLIHGRILWVQWRDKRMRPGPLGVGLWVQFTGMTLVVAVSFTRRFWRDVGPVHAAGDAALVAVAVAMTWLTSQLVRRWLRTEDRHDRRAGD